MVDDLTTEGTETFTLTLDGLGEVVNVTINDTSTTPIPTYNLSSTGSVDEGDLFDITLTTTNVSDGTSVPYTITGIQLDDISEHTGSFTVNSNTSTETFIVSDDLTTEGTETFTLTLDGLGETIDVTINDTSTTPIPTYNLSSTGSVDEALIHSTLH